MAMRGAARVERAARCGSAGLRPAAPAASATRVAAVFILHWTCAYGVSSGLLFGSVSSDCSPAAQRIRLILLSGAALRLLPRSIATIASPIASMAYGACDTSNARLEDAGADHKAALL